MSACRTSRSPTRPAGIGAVDLVLFTVKLWDTMEAADAIEPLLGGNTAVVSFQNSVVKDDVLLQALGAGRHRRRMLRRRYHRRAWSHP